MARKVVDITHSANRYDIISQTPGNYSEQNYFLRELQQKIDAEWNYRPNRVGVEYEVCWGKQKWSPLEVVIQTVKSEKGSSISDDCKNLVFRDISEDRFNIGSRFRFSANFKKMIHQHDSDSEILDYIVKDETTMNDDYRRHILGCLDRTKNVWLVTNINTSSMTSSVVVERCNGTLGSIVTDDQGVSHYHYEPVIQGRDLSSTNFAYNETAVSPQSELLVIAQHNEYTRNYYINQRFIVGYDKVYRIKAINKFYSNSTNDPENVGLMRIYLELVQSSPYDDFILRIAYQQGPTIHIDTDPEKIVGGYTIVFDSPEFIPTDLMSEEILFTPVVRAPNGEKLTGVPISTSISLENFPATAKVDESYYVEFKQVNEDSSFSLKRNRLYLYGDLLVTCSVSANNSPNGEDFSASFKMTLREAE